MSKNGHTGVVDLAKLGIQPPVDPRLQRVKIVAVDVAFLAALLQMDGTFALKMTGWPEGAVRLGTRLGYGLTPDGKRVERLEMIIHHPDFPVVLTSPEALVIHYQRVEMAAKNEGGDAP